MTISAEQFAIEYDKKFFRGRLAEFKKLLETKPTNPIEALGLLTILEDKRKMDSEIPLAEHIHAYAIKRPDYHPADSRLEPAGKKVFIKPSCQVSKNYIVRRVFDLEGALFTENLKEAEIGAYVGNYLCDWEKRMNMGEEGYPAILPLLYASRDRNLPLVVITTGKNYYEFCSGKCPEDKFMMDLIGQERIIHTIPMGRPYSRVGCLV